MSFPTQSNNLVGSQVLSQTDMGLPQSFASGAGTTGVAFSTGIPASVYVLGKTASGSATCYMGIGAASSSTFTGGASATFTTTNNFNKINTTTTNLFVRVAVTDTGSSSSFVGGTFTCFALYGLTTGEDEKSVRVGYGACASLLRGDGSGVFSDAPA